MRETGADLSVGVSGEGTGRAECEGAGEDEADWGSDVVDDAEEEWLYEPFPTRRQRTWPRQEPSKTATTRDLGTSSILTHSLPCVSPSTTVWMMPSSRKRALPSHDYMRIST